MSAPRPKPGRFTDTSDRPKVLTASIMLRFTPEMLERLQADAEANERNVSQTIRLACSRFLESAPLPSVPEPEEPRP